PLGPRRVRNSLSFTVKVTSLRTGVSPKLLLRPLMVMSGTSPSLQVGPVQGGAGHDNQDGDGRLDHGHGRHRPDKALMERVEHGDARDLVAGGDEEQGRVVVV